MSTAGYALGYLGGGLLAANSVWILCPDRFGFACAAAASRMDSEGVIWWSVFSNRLLHLVVEAGSGSFLNGDRPVIPTVWRLREQFRAVYAKLLTVSGYIKMLACCSWIL